MVAEAGCGGGKPAAGVLAPSRGGCVLLRARDAPWALANGFSFGLFAATVVSHAGKIFTTGHSPPMEQTWGDVGAGPGGCGCLFVSVLAVPAVFAGTFAVAAPLPSPSITEVTLPLPRPMSDRADTRSRREKPRRRVAFVERTDSPVHHQTYTYWCSLLARPSAYFDGKRSPTNGQAACVAQALEADGAYHE